MRLARYGPFGKETPAVLTAEDEVLDLSGHYADWNAAFFAGSGLSHLAQTLQRQAGSLPRLPAGLRVGAPIARPGKIICVGLNYSDHAKESGMEPPPNPSSSSRQATRSSAPTTTSYCRAAARRQTGR